MTDSTPPKDKVAHFRIPAEIHAHLTDYARKTRRSLNGAAVYAIEQFLAERGEGDDHDRIHTR